MRKTASPNRLLDFGPQLLITSGKSVRKQQPYLSSSDRSRCRRETSRWCPFIAPASQDLHTPRKQTYRAIHTSAFRRTLTGSFFRSVSEQARHIKGFGPQAISISISDNKCEWTFNVALPISPRMGPREISLAPRVQEDSVPQSIRPAARALNPGRSIFCNGTQSTRAASDTLSRCPSTATLAKHWPRS